MKLITFDRFGRVMYGPSVAPGEDSRVRCVECGGPCDSADAVADDSGLAWCGSLYGNGCADKVGQA